MGRRGYTKKPPKGELIDRLFEDWTSGKLNPWCKTMMDNPHCSFWEISSEVFCGQCEQLELCKKRLHPFVNELGSHFDPDIGAPIWTVLSPAVRRSIWVLAFLGEKGMRRGGYLRLDLSRIAGIKKESGNSPTDRVIDKLCELHILKKSVMSGRTKYCYSAPSYVRRTLKDGMSDEDFRLHWEEPYRKYRGFLARPVIDDLAQATQRSLGKRAPAGWGVEETTMGLLIGRQPPKCFVDYIRTFEGLMIEAWGFTVGKALSRRQRLSKDERDKLDEIQKDVIRRSREHILSNMSKGLHSHSGPGMISDDYEDVQHLLDKAVGELSRIEGSITRHDLDAWSDYLNSISYDHKTGKREESSWIISDIDPFDYE